MSDFITVDEFISGAPVVPVIDVRSESEFLQGHFPGAINIPILNNEHRSEVGITYKQKGRYEAVIKGFDLAGGKFGDFIGQVKKAAEAKEIEPKRNVFLYCWRGGMRSAIAQWILTLAGFRVYRLKGGYKIFRTWCLDSLKKNNKLLVLGGMTRTGKTEILRALEIAGEYIIDLEKMAHHKGSAFGGLGQPPQPTNEHFENRLAIRWASIPENKFAWVENESRTIGKNLLPATVYEQIRNAPVLEIKMDLPPRIQRILKEYAAYPAGELSLMTSKLKKRLGGQHLKEALQYLAEGEYENWINKLLTYYDKTYMYGMQQRHKESIFTLSWNNENIEEFIQQVTTTGKNIMEGKNIVTN